MKFTTSTVLFAAALGASAHPSGHAHKHAHRSLEARADFVMNLKPVPVAPVAPVAPAAPTTTTTQQPAPAATSQTAAAPQNAKPSSTGPPPSKGSGAAKPFCGGQSYAKSYSKKRATVADIFYKGNIGAPNAYGCNLMLVDEDVAEQYDHITTFTNADTKTQQCACFNKIGPVGGQVNGFFNGNEALKFTVAPGEKKYLAADVNTQGGCSCGPGEVALTTWGEFADTWLEFDFASDINKGWSGADASCLVAAAEKMNIQGMNVCGHGTCSTINPGGTGTNAYLGGMEAEDGVGLNIPPGPVRLSVTLAYNGSN
ncbi:hypothetical protein NLU13_6874 [Sarocladium strictum]|uniref:Allergen Asp f 4 n=1 Tax=Sarocladium strictum TaxID=5046 RepID=A0AA39L6A1_SARSR|nr:hypothetical protein NLU13_6874 [Sarocladium strictum]